MSLNIIVGVLGVIVLCVGCVLPFVFKTGKKKAPKVVSGAAIAVGLIILIIANSFEIIPTGYTGVKITFGQISDETLPNGLNWKLPFVQSIKKVNNKQQDITADGEIWSETVNRTAICYNGITITYKISEDSSAWIYANVSDPDNLISWNMISSAVKAASKTLEDEDSTNRNIIEPLVLEQMQTSVDQKYGENVIVIKKVVIQEADFEESYQESIAAKQQAQLEAEEQEIINQKNIAMAEAEYEVAIINAEAVADANEIIEDSLSEQILQQLYIEKWDGEMPDVVVGDSSSGIMISVDSFTTEDTADTESETFEESTDDNADAQEEAISSEETSVDEISE